MLLNSYTIKPITTNFPDDVLKAFDSTKSGLFGATYSLVAYLGNQKINNYTNYAFIAEQVPSVKNPSKNIVLYIVTKALDKSNKETYMLRDVTTLISGKDNVLGGIKVNPVVSNIPSNALEVFNRHFSFFLGAKNVAIALLATQVVNGAAYYFLTQSDVVAKGFNGINNTGVSTTDSLVDIQIIKLYSNFPDIESQTVLSGRKDNSL